MVSIGGFFCREAIKAKFSKMVNADAEAVKHRYQQDLEALKHRFQLELEAEKIKFLQEIDESRLRLEVRKALALHLATQRLESFQKLHNLTNEVSTLLPAVASIGGAGRNLEHTKAYNALSEYKTALQQAAIHLPLELNSQMIALASDCYTLQDKSRSNVLTDEDPLTANIVKNGGLIQNELRELCRRIVRDVDVHLNEFDLVFIVLEPIFFCCLIQSNANRKYQESLANFDSVSEVLLFGKLLFGNYAACLTCNRRKFPRMDRRAHVGLPVRRVRDMGGAQGHCHWTLKDRCRSIALPTSSDDPIVPGGGPKYCR